MIDVSLTVKACRKFRKLTPKQLEIKSGVTRQTIYRIESGGNCTVDTLQILLDALGFELELRTKEKKLKRMKKKMKRKKIITMMKKKRMN